MFVQEVGSAAASGTHDRYFDDDKFDRSDNARFDRSKNDRFNRSDNYRFDRSDNDGFKRNDAGISVLPGGSDSCPRAFDNDVC